MFPVDWLRMTMPGGDAEALLLSQVAGHDGDPLEAFRVELRHVLEAKGEHPL